LLGYILYQFGLWQKEKSFERENLLATINRYFFITSLANISWIFAWHYGIICAWHYGIIWLSVIAMLTLLFITSLANISWIFAWHYGIIWLSVIAMLTLLFFLIKIADVINKERYSLADTLFIRLPFSVYFGWITVATIANITVFLVSIGWNGFGMAESLWAVIILLIGAGIGILRMLKDKNIFYGAVLVWAYSGIWLKHVSENGFNKEYPDIIMTAIICIALFLGTIGFLKYKKKKEL